jgi:peptidoglycan/xylan/chitin deacetylase (PgdA/CDA1 family)
MNQINSFTHSVMFHHFYDDEKHPQGQGAISSSDFTKAIKYLDEHYCLISASDYLTHFLGNTLQDNHICLSFDDALKCQIDIALPILEKNNLNAFFFIYTSPLTGAPDFLEVYRHFRTVNYQNIDAFYDDFFLIFEAKHKILFNKSKEKFNHKEYLADFPFYSFNDKYFRYIRDNILSKSQYHHLMLDLFKKYAFNYSESISTLWMSEEEIKGISDQGHVIGLHSHNHPTQMHKLSKEDQLDEYQTNYNHLHKIINKDILSMSHPCGNYNNDTLSLLRDMGVKIGFRSNLGVKEIYSPFEIPREDHANIMALIK